MKTFRAKFNICPGPEKIKTVNIKKYQQKNNKKNIYYMDRVNIRKNIIKSKIFTEEQVCRIEKTGCEKVILNLLAISPFSLFRYFMALKEPEAVIKGLEMFMAALGSEVGMIIIPENEKKVVNSLMPLIRKTPNIYEKLIKDYYPLGKEEVLSRKLLNQRGEYFPGKGGCLIVSPEQAYRFYSFCNQKGSDRREEIIFVLSKRVLYYTREEESTTVLNLIEKLKLDCESFIINGDPLNGVSVVNPGEERIKDKNIISLIKENPLNLSECLSCGRCGNVCPLNLNITRSMKSFQSGGGIVPSCKVTGCVGCGLCGFFCPAWIK